MISNALSGSGKGRILNAAFLASTFVRACLTLCAGKTCLAIWFPRSGRVCVPRATRGFSPKASAHVRSSNCFRDRNEEKIAIQSEVGLTDVDTAAWAPPRAPIKLSPIKVPANCRACVVAMLSMPSVHISMADGWPKIIGNRLRHVVCGVQAKARKINTHTHTHTHTPIQFLVQGVPAK